MKTLLSFLVLCLAVSVWAEDKDTMYWEWKQGEFSYEVDTIITVIYTYCDGKCSDMIDIFGNNSSDIKLEMAREDCGSWQRRPDRWKMIIDTGYIITYYSCDDVDTLKNIIDTTWIPLCPVFMDTTKQHKEDTALPFDGGFDWDSRPLPDVGCKVKPLKSDTIDKTLLYEDLTLSPAISVDNILKWSPNNWANPQEDMRNDGLNKLPDHPIAPIDIKVGDWRILYNGDKKLNWDSLEVELNKAIKRVIEKMK